MHHKFPPNEINFSCFSFLSSGDEKKVIADVKSDPRGGNIIRACVCELWRQRDDLHPARRNEQKVTQIINQLGFIES